MTQAFKLARINGRDYCPATGEDLGVALAKAASVQEGDYRARQIDPDHWGYAVAEMYYLAAEAFEQGASASIGHNRADRYERRAAELRVRADAINAEAAASRDATRAARMQAAFNAGYADETEGSPVNPRYHFDAREAYLVGRQLARDGQPAADDVNSYRDDQRRDWIRAGGCRYRVEYPGGKIAEATVHLDGAA